ncbi:unnamed protein product [Psylliodes chrysocephalus]|uniref:DUF4371 domain-containing protein n=1 Tax=Psylliodes chrysocephalus TaxID=3402493 RepID=A0A9P0CSI6_9CUCU|nr:unnamed protein product [Psylliodes chrysocephala]
MAAYKNTVTGTTNTTAMPLATNTTTTILVTNTNARKNSDIIVSTIAKFKRLRSRRHSLECGSKLVAQSYDGAAVVAGHLGGRQAKVKEKFKHAVFVHCIAHRINLVLSRSMDNIKDCKVFFSTLSGLASFFSKSSKRTCALDIHFQKTFPKVASTRWNYNGRLAQTVFQYRYFLIHFFQDL